MSPRSTHIIDRNQVHLIELRTINGKIFTLSSIVPPISFRPCNIVIGRIKLEYPTAIIHPSRFALDAPELPVSILNYQIITLGTAIGNENYITGLQQTCRDGGLTDLPFVVRVVSSFSKQSHPSTLNVCQTRARTRESVCHRLNVGLQLLEVEAWCKAGLFSFWWKNGVRLIHTLIPPVPGCLLCISPSEHGHSILVVRNCKNRVAIIGQRARRPGLVGIELLNAVLLNLETQVDTAKELDGLLDMSVILRIDARIGDDLVTGYTVLAPIVQHIKLVQAAVLTAS